MALLAYLVMIAFLMTTAFLGVEWVVTSTPKNPHHVWQPKTAAVLQKRKDYLASLAVIEALAEADRARGVSTDQGLQEAKSELAGALVGEAKADTLAQSTPSNDADADNQPVVRKKKVARHLRGEVTQAYSGYGGFSYGGAWSDRQSYGSQSYGRQSYGRQAFGNFEREASFGSMH
jgi:hypothetical protein